MRFSEASRQPGSQGEVVYDEAPVRAWVVHLARLYGGPALDVGTGACACMAVAIARSGMQVTALDSGVGAIRMAEERAAVAEVGLRMDVRHGNAGNLPFPDDSYRVVIAFDMLCHTHNPARILEELFRVCAPGGAVIITELNGRGREVTRHHDPGFGARLPHLVARHCRECQRYDHPHHRTFVCEEGDRET